jgi:hypothetical protein
MHMNGVDHKDRDTADWTISVKTNWFYMRIFFWLTDGVLHAMYTILKASIGNDEEHTWFRFLSINDGRYKFQMEMGAALISSGITMDWEDITDMITKPPYMRQRQCVPCQCEICFFCVNGMTTGIDHKKGRKRRTEVKQPVDAMHGGGDNQCSITERGLVRESDGESQRCKVCYQRRRSMNPKISAKEPRKACKGTRLGCPSCQAFVCKDCWSGYEHY